MGTLKTDFEIRGAELSLKIACSCALFLCCWPLAASTIDYRVSQEVRLSGGSAAVDPYAYYLDSVDRSNGPAGPGFDIGLFQLNHPPGAQDDGASPGQASLTNQPDRNPADASLRDLLSSVTVTIAPLATSPARKPSGSSPGLEGLAVCGVVMAAGHRRLRTAWQESK
jgi:hypothetical protein